MLLKERMACSSIRKRRLFEKVWVTALGTANCIATVTAALRTSSISSAKVLSRALLATDGMILSILRVVKKAKDARICRIAAFWDYERVDE